MNLSSLNYIAEGIRVKPGATDVLHEMAMGVRSCTSRIKDILGEEKGQRVIDGLNAEIELQREDHLVPFAWDLSMYRNPPVNWDTAQPFTSTSNALLAGVREEAEAIVRMEDAGGPINKDMANCNIGDYLVCVSNPSDPLKRPFWVGQVVETYRAQEEFKVHWLLPPTKHPSSGGKGAKRGSGETEDMEAESTSRAPIQYDQGYVSPANPPKERQNNLQEPNLQCKIKNYPYAQFCPVMDVNTAAKSNSSKGVRKVVMPHHMIPFQCVCFSFPNLKPNNCLPNNVLDELSRDKEIKWKG